MAFDWEKKCDEIYYARLDLDNWIKRAKNNGPLHYYRGSDEDYEGIAKYLLETQCRDQTSKRFGLWKGDNPEWESFDEGCAGKGLAVLALLIKELRSPTAVVIEDADGTKLSMGEAVWNAKKAIDRHQFTPKGGQPFPGRMGWYGVPGFWPQAPGWEENEAKFPVISGYRTVNDGVSSDNVEALIVFMRALETTHDGAIPKRIELAGEGFWWVMQNNNGWMPEQMGPFGEPVWGRGHEPPSYSPRSLGYALSVFNACHIVLGDDVWLNRCFAAKEKLDKIVLDEEGNFPHFLEVGTLRPIWGNGQWQVTYNPDEARWPSKNHGSPEVVGKGYLKKFNYYLTQNDLERRSTESW